jgi:hypothetical protein
MAVDPGLNPRARRRLLALVAAVLLAHVAALHGFSRWQAQSSLLKPMVAPMYTRLLQPEKPPEPPQVAQAAPAPPVPPTRMRATPSVPPRVTKTLPEPVAPPPPDEELVAQEAPPEPDASPSDIRLGLPASPAVPGEAPPAAVAASAPTPGTATASVTPSGTATATTTAAVSGGLDGWPADTRLRYRLGGRFRSGELYGDARVLWQRDGSRYQVRVEVDLTFLASVVMTSQGEVGADMLMPQRYEEVRNGKPRGLRIGEREVMLGNGKIVPRPAGVQDTASQFVELSHRFASGLERLEVGQAVSFWMARPAAVDLWTYDIVESEILATPLGQVEAFRLKPRPIANPRGNITIEMWFAPSLQYLPVRIQVNMGDEARIDLLVESIEQR